MSTQPITHKGNPNIATARAPSLNLRRRDFARALLALVGLAFAAVAQTASAAIPSSERQVLDNIYTSTNGANWTIHIGWNGAAGTECTWFGISCDGTQSHVTGISLGSNNLTGTLPALTGLTNLWRFDVNTNQLSGHIPVLTGLTSLTFFYVDNNQLTGPLPDLTGLMNLTFFHVYNNQLTGTIPALTGTNLFDFEVNSNQLTGPLPDLTGLWNLYYFDVDSNQLTGPIPDLTGLTNLNFFFLYNNKLTGPIPALTGTNLFDFEVNSNQLTGPIPDLTGLMNLAVFNVNNNHLNGPVPAPPASLVATGSSLCPNLLNTTPGANDAGWNTATGHTPWWATPHANNRCDEIFTDGFED